MSSRRQYPFDLIEPKWQQAWAAEQTFRAFNPGESLPEGHPFAARHALAGQPVTAAQLPPKYYILDMFPYPSGAGLHVGHPEGYTATDILARYRRAKGFNVLHPMGWDSFGLPAEQYAVKTGQHPRVTTEANISNFTRQIKSLGFSYDWTRELATTDPEYFRWTQWIFLQVYNSWFNPETNRAEPIDTLKYPADCDTDAKRRAYRDAKRLAYVSEQPVWWCEELGTVLANEEVVDGKSEVGGFPVVRKPMRQWVLRITAFAERLLDDLNTIEWTDSLKEMQRNWIGRSEGAEVHFTVVAEGMGSTGHRPVPSGDSPDGTGCGIEAGKATSASSAAAIPLGGSPSGTGESPVPPASAPVITVFTTRPDTLFGATYMVISPEHKLVEQILPRDWPSILVNAVAARKDATAVSTVIAAAQAPALVFGVEMVDLNGFRIAPDALGGMTAEQALRHRAVPLYFGEDSLVVAISDPTDLDAMDALRHELSVKNLEFRVATETDIERVLLQNFGVHVGYALSPAEAVTAYRSYSSGKSDLERTELAKEKTGVFTGAYAINPVNGERIPIWIADYVLASYGTGAIMGVPAHDERDWEFAKKFNLLIKVVVLPSDQISGLILEPKKALCEEGEAIFSPDWAELSLRHNVPAHSPEYCDLNGLPTAEAKAKITAWLEAKGLGKKTINYKLRDWLFSRQRYWGEPFPIVWRRDAATGQPYHEALPESALPLLPPALTDYKPTASGEPPLARAKDWVNLPDGAVREVNTMPQWAGSCWYYLRYLDPKNSERFLNTAVENYWMGKVALVMPRSLAQVEQAIDELVSLAVQEPGSARRRVVVGPVSDREADQIQQIAQLDVRGFVHVLDNYAVRHTFKSHGVALEEEAQGQLAVTREHFHHLPEVLLTPDRIEHLGNNERGLPMLRLSKRVNGCVMVVEEVRASKDYLAVLTMYVRKAAAASDAAIGAPLSTAETDRRVMNVLLEEAAVKQSTPGVDLYVGGTEHAVLHLLYARFWHKVLFDLGHVSTAEPFYKLVNQGLILGEDGQKMSKSRGNVVNPDDVLAEYGADAFRLYEMFMGPLQDTKPWNTKGVEGVYRFLGRVWRLLIEEKSETAFEQAQTTAAQPDAELLEHLVMNGTIADVSATPAQLKALHACIKKVTEDLDHLRFNTAISAMMVFVNEANGWQTRPLSVMRTFLQLLAPFAPHITEELWARLHRTFGQHPPSLTYTPWPSYDPALLVESEIEVPVSVNGKHRDVIRVPADADNATLEAAAKAAEKIRPFLEGKTVKKVIIPPKRNMVNLVVG